MEALEGLELICKKEKEIIENCDQIIRYCESYKNKAKDLKENVQQIRQTHRFRKEYYKALNAITCLQSYTNEFMCELELNDPFENEKDCEIIEVPCLPDGECQNQQFEMIFLHGSSPWNFWLSHCEENISRRLKELLLKRANNLQELVEKPICGDYVLYKQGAHLQRAIVQKTLTSDRLQILDIDSGATALIRLKRLYKMDEEISLIPYQAINCFLIKNSDDCSLWTKELQEIFSSTLNRCKLTVKIIEKSPGYPTSFFVNLKAEDIDDDTEMTVDVGKWIFKRVIPELKTRSTLSVSVLDAFFSEVGDDDNEDYDDDQSSNSSSQNRPSTNKLSESRSSEKINVEVITVTSTTDNTQALACREEEEAYVPTVIKANERLSPKIAANFQGNSSISMRNYPVNPVPPTNALMTVYNPGMPISSRAILPISAGPIMSIPPPSGPIGGYSMVQRSPNSSPMIYPAYNTASISHYPIAHRPTPAINQLNSGYGYPNTINSRSSEPNRARNAVPPTISWSTSDYNTVVDRTYEKLKLELKTPVVLVRPKDELRAICAFVISPNEFYVHLANENNTKIDLLEQDLENFYSKSSTFHYHPNSKSKYCACKYICNEEFSSPLSTWFRAEVISWKEAEALVFLVDYGVTIWRQITELRELDQRFFVYDKMAQRSHLHGVPFVGHSDYLKDINKFFKSILYNKDDIQLIVEENNKNKYGNSLEVRIKRCQGDGFINDDIIEFIKSKESEWNPMKEDFYADTNRLDHVIDNPLMATGGYIPKHEQRVCKFFAEKGRCHKKACRQEHTFMGPDVFTIDRAETYADTFNKVKLPEEGSKIKVKVIAAITATRFYAHWLYDNVTQKNTNKHGQYKYDDDDEDEYHDDIDDEEEETLHSLMNALNSPNNTRTYKHLEGGYPSVGEMVIVKTCLENREVIWCRARVSEVDEKYCVVFLIDFGMSEEVLVNNLRAMDPRFLHLPAQATQFCLSGVEALWHEWDPHFDENQTYFLSQWENTCLFANVIKRDHINQAVEVNLFDRNGASIRRKLVETGKYRSFDLTFGEDSHLIPG